MLNVRVGNLFFLLLGVSLWSIVSEFGTRYSIYVSDNSGKSLSDERVNWRKTVQNVIADLFLMLPFFIVFIGFAIQYFQDNSISDKTQKNIGFGIPILLLYIVFNIIARFYFTPSRKHRMLPIHEWDWCNKLYGIYNDYVFQIRKANNFQPLINTNYDLFVTIFLSASEKDKEAFPQNENYITAHSLVPKEFLFQEYKEDKDFNNDSRPVDSRYRWIYKIPNFFYRTLHKQLQYIVIISLIIFTIICFLPIGMYKYIGAPGLVTIAFACWSGIWIGLIYTDYALLRNFHVSSRFIFLLLLILCSYINIDHPVRMNTDRNYWMLNDKDATFFYSRLPLNEHFDKWFDNYKADTNMHYIVKNTNDTIYPVVFVCAEGGALRTGAFAAMTLPFLQDSLKNHFDSIDFKKTIYAFSGVSGGSVGLSYFNATEYLSKPEDLKDYPHSELVKDFFSEDFLSPVLGKMFYGDILNLFRPSRIESFDRAIALEKAWEDGYKTVIKKDARNVFSSDFISVCKENPLAPAMFINTEEVETGLQCWLTNVTPDTSMFFCKKRDLFNYKIRGGINYSTMTNFSSRFPLFSPAASLAQDDNNNKLHYADGGYVENSGAATMLEILQVLKPKLQFHKIKPFVLLLRYSKDVDGYGTADISFSNEISEILYGIYNTRSGRGRMAIEELKRFIDTNFHKPANVIEFALDKTNSEVPLNWVSSKKSLKLIEEDIKAKWENKDQKPLIDLFAFDTANCIICKKWKPKQTAL